MMSRTRSRIQLLQPRVIWAVWLFEDLAWALRVYLRVLHDRHACVLRVMRHGIFHLEGWWLRCCELNYDSIFPT